LREEIPEAYVSYFAKFLDSLASQFEGRLYRYITPAESVYWVAYEGFHLGRTYTKKISMTLSPVLYTWSLVNWNLRGVWLELAGDFYDWARAVPYTYEVDPRTKDPIYVYEFEIAVYTEDYEHKVRMDYPWVSDERRSNYMVLPIRDVQMARLNPEAVEGGINEKDYFKLKVLPSYIHGRVLYRHPYRLLPRRVLVQQLAIATVARRDLKVRVATNYAWDWYWQQRHMLAYPPNYEKALDAYKKWDFVTVYQADEIESTCLSSYIPMDVCWELIDEVADEIIGIYDTFGVSAKYTDRRASKPSHVAVMVLGVVSSEARALYRSFPNLFASPEEAEHFLKWWHSTYEEAFKYLSAFLWNERVYRRIRLRDDPEVAEG
jgi:hypothetical protein